jgi:hypothetical protein
MTKQSHLVALVIEVFIAPLRREMSLSPTSSIELFIGRTILPNYTIWQLAQTKQPKILGLVCKTRGPSKTHVLSYPPTRYLIISATIAVEMKVVLFRSFDITLLETCGHGKRASDGYEGSSIRTPVQKRVQSRSDNLIFFLSFFFFGSGGNLHRHY